jgi:hypothetical protein
VGAVLAAGFGFVAQFMGLRGLAYPCSLAQVLAIFTLAFIRAIIRRRLGRRPSHLSAPASHEIDLLATYITYCPRFRTFTEAASPEATAATIPLHGYSLNEVFQWKVRTAHAGDAHPSFVHVLSNSPDGFNYRDCPEGLKNNKYLELASSQQLVRVRERLGDLCEWSSDALRAAQSLAQSIEAVMNTLFTPSSRKEHASSATAPFDRLEWIIDTVGPSWFGRKLDSVTVTIERSQRSGKWRVDIGQLDAILSLWLASEAARLVERPKHSDKQEEAPRTQGSDDSPNWRRKKAGLETRYNYCRILGDDPDDGILQRDLAWWIDESIAEESESFAGSARTTAGIIPGNRRSGMLHHQDSSRGPRWYRSRARDNVKDLIIGFNGQGRVSKSIIEPMFPRNAHRRHSWS